MGRLDSLAGSELCGSYGRALSDEPGHFVGHEHRPDRAGLVSKAHQHAVGIEPSIVWRQNRRAEVVDVHRGEPALDFIGFEPLDVASEALLRVEVRFQHIPLRRRNDEQVTVLLEADLGSDAVDNHRLGEVLEEADAVLGEFDVLGQREKATDAARGSRR